MVPEISSPPKNLGFFGSVFEGLVCICNVTQGCPLVGPLVLGSENVWLVGDVPASTVGSSKIYEYLGGASEGAAAEVLVTRESCAIDSECASKVQLAL